jgi:hypothetical protein
MAKRRLKVLLVLKHSGYIGVYASLVEELALRGHSVHVACVGADGAGEAILDELANAHATVTHGPAPARSLLDGWSSVAWLARALGDLGRYSHPRFENVPALRDRMAAKVESHLRHAAGFDPLTRRLALQRARALHARIDSELSERAIGQSTRLEQGIPTSGRVTAFVQARAPDLILVSPLVDLASSLLEYLKAAQKLRIPTGVCVASWDNLSSKGLLRFVPERVFVWNELQRREAVELHGVPADRVVATGAARFDDWFAQRPSSSREEFAAKIGLDTANPFLLYVCSSAFIVSDETAVVLRWLRSLRGSKDERLRGAGVIVRPHPKRREPWRTVDLSRSGNATIWPREPNVPERNASRADFYDAIAHSAAVVGANTSAMLEAAIAGRNVYTWLAPEFAQESTIHFHYLLHENGGFLHVASSEHEHLEQLARGLADEGEEAERTRRFVESFLRPGGLERPATAIYADAVEELASLRLAPGPEDRSSFALRAALAPIAAAGTADVAARVAAAAVRRRLVRTPRAERSKPRPTPARA